MAQPVDVAGWVDAPAVDVAPQLRLRLRRDVDDFDSYQWAQRVIDDVTVTLRCYDGAPDVIEVLADAGAATIRAVWPALGAMLLDLPDAPAKATPPRRS